MMDVINVEYTTSDLEGHVGWGLGVGRSLSERPVGWATETMVIS